MVNVSEYANLSQHVYDTELKPKSMTILHITSQVTLGSDWGIVTDLNYLLAPAGHFFAALYIKFENNRAVDAVIAFRGTEVTDYGNIKTDFKAWHFDVVGDGERDEVPDYFTQAYFFVIKAENYISKYFKGAKIRITGHSLGGALAQLIPALGHQPYEAIAFNSPGIGNIHDVNLDTAPLIHNINSRYGFINKIGKVIGSVDYVSVSEMQSLAKNAFENYKLEKEAKNELLKTKNPFVRIFDLEEIKTAKTMAAKEMIVSLYSQHNMANMIEAIAKDHEMAIKTFL